MSRDVKLRRYSIQSQRGGSGWAVIVLGSDGFFSACSDYGNYAYWWPQHGCKDFRQFLLSAHHNWDYFAKKLNGGKISYDVEMFVKVIMKQLGEILKTEMDQEGIPHGN